MDQHSVKTPRAIAHLKAFQPRPSAATYHRMASAPWQYREGGRVSPRRLLPTPALRAAAVVGLILILVAVVWTTPSLRTAAQEILDSLFNRAGTDSIVIEYPIVETPSGTLAPEMAETFYSVRAAETATGIDIRQPGIDLGQFSLSGVTINHTLQTTWLIYNAPGRYLSIYERAADLGWLDEGLVGATAQITPVEFLDANGVTLHGEYVEGGWLPTTDPTPVGGDRMQEPAEWTTQTTQRRLRWQDSDRVYEMVAFGGNGDLPDRDLSLDGLIAIAASMR